MKKLAAQGILTYCATRPLPYHLYADEGALLVLPTLVTSVILSKTSFLTECKDLCASAQRSFFAVIENQTDTRNENRRKNQNGAVAEEFCREHTDHRVIIDVKHPIILAGEEYLVEHDSFGEGGLDEVFEKTDLFVAPSIWKETFGFVALEALSRGVPVIVTENVGAKDLVVHGENGLVIKPQKEALYRALEQLINEPQLLQHMNDTILKMDFPYTMQAHVKEVQAKIYS